MGDAFVEQSLKYITEFLAKQWPALKDDPATVGMIVGLLLGGLLVGVAYWLIHRGTINGLEAKMASAEGQRDILQTDNESLRHQINELKENLRATKSEAVVKADESRPSRDLVEFVSNRSALNNRQPLSKTFREGNDVHVYFLSGEGVFSTPRYLDYINRMMLPNPECEYLKVLQSHTTNVYLNARRQIKLTTKLALNRRVEIKWFDNFIGCSLVFCNPDEPNGWLQIETTIPFVEAEDKHVIRIEKTLQPEVYRIIYDGFKKMWEVSKRPTLADCGE